MHIKNVSSTSKIKEILKENIAYDPLFMKKMQKIHTKNSSCSSIGINQLTHSNLFGSNMNKIQLETSLQNKALKNSSSHTKNLKKNNNSLEEHSSSNHYKPSSPRFEKANLVKDKNSSFIMENNKISSMKSISSNKFHKYHNIKSANVSKSKSKGKNKVNGASSNYIFSKSNAHLFVKYGNVSQNTNTKSSNIFSPYEGISSSSNTSLKFDFKKISKTAYHSKNNSRKNSAEKKNIYNGGNNGNTLIKSLEVGSRLISANKKNGYNVNVNVSIGNTKNPKASISSLLKAQPQSESNSNNGINGNIFHYKGLSDIQNKNGGSYINNLIKSTQFNHGYKNDVKYIEYITSGLKNNNSTKNTSLSNKSSKKKEEIEKDYLQTKIQLKYNKNKNSLTTVQSKQNSKSTSRVEEYSNVNTKQSDYKKAASIKHNVPLTACQSPCGKSAQNIFQKNPLICNNEPTKKAYLKKNIDLHYHNNNSNNDGNHYKVNKDNSDLFDESKQKKLLEDIKCLETESGEIDKMLNCTMESMQSTARESMYYRKELEKLSNYIKQYHFINGSYPETKIQFYKYGRVIGKGAFGKVNLALHVCSGRLVAIKSFNKKKLKSKHAKSKIKHEIEILKKLRNPFISQ